MHKNLKRLIVLLSSLAYPVTAQGQGWSTDFGAPPAGKGLNSSAQALLEYQGRLIVAGSFTQAGPLAVNRIAAWDGTQWSALDAGLIDTAEGLAEYQGDLIAAGGGPPAMLMRWDGSAWSTIPSPPGSTGIFWSAYPYDGYLFVNSFENGVSKLAWWDGLTWSSVPLPLDAFHTDAEIYAMTVYGGQLFMTGESYGPGGYDGFLFAWDGETFGGPGWVFPTDGLSLHVYHELLYVGGDWNPEPPLYGVAVWDQSSWIPFGPGPGGVRGMETYHGRIVMGGEGITSFNGITYNGQNEQWLGGGCSYNMWVFDVKEFQGDLYAAGVFDEICTENSQIQSSYIAKWSEPATAVSARPAVRGLRIECTPNPFNPSVALTIHVPLKSEVTVAIFDATGRVVRRVASGVQNPGPYRITWNGVGDSGERLASGVYFARVTAGKETATSKLVLLK